MEPRFMNLITPKPKRNYDAFELHLRKRFSNNWRRMPPIPTAASTATTRGSRAPTRMAATPERQPAVDNTVMSYNPQEQLVYGVLNSDRPHQFKLSGSYDFNFGLSVGAFYILESGLPNSTTMRVSGGGYPSSCTGGTT